MLKVLHTADWHIGQTFHEHDRTFEHEQFLLWLVTTIKNQKIDVLLVSGDVFDGPNPATTSVNLWYSFLANVTKAMPHLQVIVTAGNHDSAARLEAPNPFFEFYNIRIIGTVQQLADGNFNYEQLLIPIKDKEGAIKAWCLAIPYLRPGDYPMVPETSFQYAEGVTALYKEAYAYALTMQQPGQAIIAMGHLHTLGTEKCGNDKKERLIMGGIEYVPASAFNENLAYTALGHIHKAQRIGGKDNIRYSGSPIPMSFSEINYKHQVVIFELAEDKAVNINMLEVPVTIPLIRVPAEPKILSEVLEDLLKLPEAGNENGLAPYLEVRVLQDGPDPSRRYKVETALKNKHVRFTRIDLSYPEGVAAEKRLLSFDELQHLKPTDIFNNLYKSRFSTNPPQALMNLLNEVIIKVNINNKEA